MKALRALAASAALSIILNAPGAAASTAETDQQRREAERAPAEREAAASGLEIVVTATRGEQAIADAPATMSVIAGTELRRRPVQDLAEALENEPGVVIGSVGLTRRGISIRGMPSEHLLTLTDGRRVNDSSANMAHVDYDLSWVPSIAIDRVEVVRGPLSAPYGSEALAGVINVITRRPDRLEASGLALLGRRDGEGGDTGQISALVGGPVVGDTLGLVAWGEYRVRNRTASLIDPRVSELESREGWTASAVGWWQPSPDHRIEIGQSAADDVRIRDALSTGAPPFIALEYRDDITRAQTHGSYAGDFGWAEVQARAYRSVLERVNSRTRGQVPTPPTRLTDTVLDARVTIEPFAGNRLTLGGEHRHETLEDQVVNAEGETSVNHDALFVQNEWNITDALALTVGSRFDHHQAYGWQTSPRGYLIVKPVEGLRLRGGIGRAFKAPSLKELSPSYRTVAGGGRFIITGNPDLKPETSTAYELGASYYGRGWNVGATLFQNDLSGLIQTNCAEFCGIRGRERRTYLNVERARMRGAELSGEVSPAPTLTLSANYTYVEPRNMSANRELAERPRHSGNVKLAWEPGSGTELNVRGRYVGAQTIYQGDIPVRLDPYDLWSVNVSQALNEHLTLKAGVDNVFKRRLAKSSALYSFAEPGRVFFVGMGANF